MKKSTIPFKKLEDNEKNFFLDARKQMIEAQKKLKSVCRVWCDDEKNIIPLTINGSQDLFDKYLKEFQEARERFFQNRRELQLAYGDDIVKGI
ncbi:MAG: hypothetical protein FWE45_04540 [Firmicutes bacterium]|nr:hypothetical protein [Bacillota bacterium]